MMRQFVLFALTCVIICQTTKAEVGQTIADFSLSDHRGKEFHLKDVDSKLIVVAFMGTECPLAKLYCARLNDIVAEYSKDVTVWAVYSNVQDSLSDLAGAVKRHEMTYPALKDPGNRVADLFKAERTPEIFLLDQNRVVRYHGRVDDQYVIGIVREKPQRADLKLAIDELLNGQPVSVPETQPLGCFIGRVRTPNEDSEVTYSNQVSRILQNRCVECHRDGEIAPFELTSYESAAGWGETLVEVIQDNRMPPWHASPKHGEFKNDRSMTPEEEQIIETWVKNGCPQGDPADLPEPIEFTEGWQLEREPDDVFKMRDRPYHVAADAGPRGIAYQNFWVDPEFTEDKWVKAAEVRPGNRAVVHHIIVYVHPGGRKNKGKDRIFLAAYVPGLRSTQLPEGAAKKIPAGSHFQFQVHYTPIGSEEEDLSEVGFIYAEPSEITHIVHTTEVANPRFELEPFKKDQEVTARSKPGAHDLQLLSMSPHMHLRGQAFRYELEYPNGDREVLLDIPEYDFNWQTRYELTEPKSVPAGTRMYCTALFDNSEENLANPDPSKTIKWGDQSWDEMMIGYFDVMVPREDLSSTQAKPIGPGLNVQEVLKRWDLDGDGQLSKAEAAKFPVISKVFDKVDQDGDGIATVREIDAALQRLKQRKQ